MHESGGDQSKDGAIRIAEYFWTSGSEIVHRDFLSRIRMQMRLEYDTLSRYGLATESTC